MEFHLPKPFHNWREFAKEVGIIVIGIAIALSGELAIETINHHREIQKVREALNDEMAWNLAVAKQVSDHSGCSLARLDEIERWEKSWEDGRPIRLLRPIVVPGSYIYRTSVWRVTAGDAVSRMPFDERAVYASFYDGIEGIQGQRLTLIDAWDDLALHQHARRLSDEQLLNITGDIQAIRKATGIMISDYEILRDFAAKEQVSPGKLLDVDWIAKSLVDQCQPLLAD